MGLFDKAIKKGLSDALGGALGDKVGKVTDVIENATGLDLDGDGKQGGSQNPFGSPGQNPSAPGQDYTQQTAPTAYQTSPQVKDKAYFREIILSNFGGYDIREDVPVSALGGEGQTYDFALYDERNNCAGVIILVAHNRDNNRAYKGARSAAQAAGVPFINFYTHMPNEREFVFSRIVRLTGSVV